MTKATLYGFRQSSYVWTARAAFAYKGLEVDFHPIEPPAHKGAEHLARHPWGKVPALVAGDLNIFETSAIVRWVDSHEGPALFPKDPVHAAHVEQWVSSINSYLYPPAVLDYILKYLFAGEEGPDRSSIDSAVPKIKEAVAAMAGRIENGPWLVGDNLSAADLFAGPLLFALSRFPEGKQLLGEYPKIGRLLAALSEIPAFMSAAPSAS